MKSTIYNLVLGAIAVFALANCSNSDGGSNTNVGVGYCQSGQVYTQQYGCLVQANHCGSGTWGNYNGQCVQGTINTGGSSCPSGQAYVGNYNGQVLGCLPIGSCQQYVNQYGRLYAYYNDPYRGPVCIEATSTAYNTGSNQQCGSGMIYSSTNGCVQSCGTNMGWINGQCQYVNGTTSTGSGWNYN